MKIAIIGAGNVGGALGKRLAAKGHDIVYGVRQGGTVKTHVPAGARLTSVEDAVKGVEVVILATPWNAARDAVKSAGAESGVLDGLVVIDATNPLAANLTVDAGPNGASGAQRIQALAPRAHVVKAFNTTGFNNMADPIYGGSPVSMFYAGDDADAKAKVRALIADVGFDPIDAGPLSRSVELEHLAVLWISMSLGKMGREFAFRVVRR
jgi:predicted dinucleotide-binding enzyme